MKYPLSVITVKIGTKFTSKDVNRVLTMARRTINQPFKFFCYTDDSAGLDSDVSVIPYVDFGLSPIVYNKLYLFSEGIPLPHGTCLYFDLDVVLTKPIDFLLDHVVDTKLTVVKTYWRSMEMMIESDALMTDFDLWYFCHKRPHDINSSIMLWNNDSGDHHHIWDQFMRNPEPVLTEFFYGMDGYLFYQHRDILSFFPKGTIGSLLYGVDYDVATDEVDYDLNEVSVVLLNNAHDPKNYEKYKQYFT